MTELRKRSTASKFKRGRTARLKRRIRSGSVDSSDNSNSSNDSEDTVLNTADEAEFQSYLSEFIQGSTDQLFFIYNRSAKGPKAAKLNTILSTYDPHKLLTYSDPVSSAKKLETNESENETEVMKFVSKNVVESDNNNEFGCEFDVEAFTRFLDTTDPFDSTFLNSPSVYSNNLERGTSSDDLLDKIQNKISTNHEFMILDQIRSPIESCFNELKSENLFENIFKFDFDSNNFLHTPENDQEQFTYHPVAQHSQSYGNISQHVGTTENVWPITTRSSVCSGEIFPNFPLVKSIEETKEKKDVHIGSSDHSSSPSPTERLRATNLNNLSPNPKKLLEIGYKMNSLSKTFNSLSRGQHSAGLNLSIEYGNNKSSLKGKSLMRKKGAESSKRDMSKGRSQIGSKICRLKHRASVEAYKIALEGIQREQESLIFVEENILDKLKTMLADRLKKVQRSLCQDINLLMSQNLDDMIAGNKDSYVKKVLVSTANELIASKVEPSPDILLLQGEGGVLL